jgi:hypothetical protein
LFSRPSIANLFCYGKPIDRGRFLGTWHNVHQFLVKLGRPAKFPSSHPECEVMRDCPSSAVPDDRLTNSLMFPVYIRHRDHSYRTTIAWKVLQAHGFGNKHRELASIGGILAMETNIQMNRRVKRVKGALVIWFDENLPTFLPYLDRFRIETQGEERVLYYRDHPIILEDKGRLPVEFRSAIPTFDARCEKASEKDRSEALDQFLKDVGKPGRVPRESLELPPFRKSHR